MKLDKVFVAVRDSSNYQFPCHDGICAGVFSSYEVVAQELHRQGYKHLHYSVWMPCEPELDEVIADKSDQGETRRWDFWGNNPELGVHVFCLPLNVFIDQLVLNKFDYDAEGVPVCSA